MRWINHLWLHFVHLKCAVDLILLLSIIGIIEVQVHLLALGLDRLLLDGILILRKLVDLIE